MAATKKASAQAEQHPAAKGEPEVEVAKRSADGATGSRHEKVYVLPAGATLPEQDGPEHDDNRAGVVREAIQFGMHPRGEPRLDGVEDAADGVSRAYRYSVEVVPSAVDSEPEKTTTPRAVVASGSEQGGR